MTFRPVINRSNEADINLSWFTLFAPQAFLFVFLAVHPLLSQSPLL